MPGVVMNGSTNTPSLTATPHGRWIDQQQYLVETYRQIRANLGQLEAEIEAARLRVTDWSVSRRQTSRSRSLSHASVSTNASSILSCNTDTSFLNANTDSATTCSSCHSSCSSTCGMKLPYDVAAKLSAATLISAFLAASHDFTRESVKANNTSVEVHSHQSRARTPDEIRSNSKTRSNRSASPSTHKQF